MKTIKLQTLAKYLVKNVKINSNNIQSCLKYNISLQFLLISKTHIYIYIYITLL